MDSHEQIDLHSRRISARSIIYEREIPTFLSQQLKIQTKEVGGLIPLNPNPVQVPIIKSIQEQLKTKGKIRQIWFKCRQPGASTIASSIIWWLTSLFPNVYSFVIAQDKTTVGRLFRMHDVFYTWMHPDFKPMRQYFTKGTEIVLGNPNAEEREDNPGLQSSILVGEAKNINVGTGMTIHGFHGSECSRWPYVEPIKESLIPALSNAPRTVQILESTAHFAAGSAWFRDQCERAMRGETDFEYHFIEWWKLPEYAVPLKKGEKLKLDPDERYLIKNFGMTMENIKWRRMMISQLEGDLDSFKLSYPCDWEEGWITKQSTAFPWSRMMEMIQQLKPPKWRFEVAEEDGRLYEDPEGKLKVWFKPEKDKMYDVGNDVAEGNEDGAYSTACVIERGTNKQVAEWRGHIMPHGFGDVVAAIGWFYNTAQVAPEITGGWGQSTLDRLRNLDYPNVFQWRKLDTIVPKYTNLQGWETSYNSKSIMVHHARELVWQRECQIFSEELWSEMKTFVRNYTPGGRVTYDPIPNTYSDLVMAWMIALKVSDLENYEKYEGMDEKREDQIVEEYRDPAFYDADGLNRNVGTDYEREVGDWK